MKHFLLFTLLLLGLSFTGCGDDDDGGMGGPSDDVTFFTAKVDGVEFDISGLFAYGIDDNDGELAFYGVETDGAQRTIYLLLRDDGGEGTYNLGFDTQATGFVTVGGVSYSTFDQGASGSFTLSELSEEKATGTFSFTALDGNGGTVEITDGEFAVEFRD